jgi:uncharacterized glyoxalase superfamily protein PhnB
LIDDILSMTLALLLHCKNIEETQHFYRSVLGFSANICEGILTAEHFDQKLLFTSQDLWDMEPACSGTIYLTTPDVERYFNSLNGKVALAWPLQDMSYGSREFGVIDCNGYHLAFQQQV